MKKLIISGISIVMLFFLFACADDEPIEPEPEQRPKPTLRPILERETEPVCEHFWKNPDCHHPYICLDCGETKGSPLEHVWTDANYQEPSECELCGDIDGEPLEPNFTAQGFSINTTAGRPYDYKTITNQDPDMTTVGEATLMYVDIFESDEDHTAVAGYEYIVARIMITFEDENASINGFKYLTGQLDYYGFDPDERVIAHDDLEDSDFEDFKVANRRLNFYGEYYDYFLKHTQVENVWVGDTSYVVLEYIFLVPVGYNGIIIYISNAANFSNSDSRVLSDNFDSDTLFFRLRMQTD